MDISKAAIIEFLLFASQKPLSISQLKEITGDLDTEQIKEALTWLKESLYYPGRALQIREVGGGFQICTREEFHPWLKYLSNYQARHRLSPASLEVLAIVIYKQPVTRNEIEEIRGVSSGFLLRNLLRQKLIRITGRKDCPGRPILYGSGKEFLSYFGLKDISELPKESELKDLIFNEESK